MRKDAVKGTVRLLNKIKNKDMKQLKGKIKRRIPISKVAQKRITKL